jgi:hypothetical protein
MCLCEILINFHFQQIPKGEEVQPKSRSGECSSCLCRKEADTVQCPECQITKPALACGQASTATTTAPGDSRPDGLGFNLGSQAETKPADFTSLVSGLATTPTPITTGFSYNKPAISTTFTSVFSFEKPLPNQEQLATPEMKPKPAEPLNSSPLSQFRFQTPVEIPAEEKSTLKLFPFSEFSFSTKTKEVTLPKKNNA